MGEFELISRYFANCGAKRADSAIGVGDDGAVLDFGTKKAVISTDLLIEGVHFDLAYMPLRHLGYKAVVANVSDICAMNATPSQITVSIAVSNRFPLEALEELFDGITMASKVYNVEVIGGDTTSSQKGLIISITAIGEANTEDIVYRNGAQVSDLLVVSGDIGAAYMGLQILELEKQKKDKEGIIKDVGLLSDKFLSFYSYELAASVPTSIALTDIDVYPVIKEVKNKEKVEIEAKTILVKGVTVDEDDFNNWLRTIKTLDWLQKFEIEDLKKDKKNNTQFTIAIWVK